MHEQGREGEEEQVTAEVIKLFETGGYAVFSDEADPDDATSPEEVLEHAKSRNLQQVIVIGVDGDREISIASSNPALSDVYFLLAHAKRILLEYGIKEHVYGDS